MVTFFFSFDRFETKKFNVDKNRTVVVSFMSSSLFFACYPMSQESFYPMFLSDSALSSYWLSNENHCMGWTNKSSNEENAVQLLAAQIIELHAYISPRSRFAQSGVDAGWSLWKMATTTNVENLKISALSALAEISSGTVFDWLFEYNILIGHFDTW